MKLSRDEVRLSLDELRFDELKVWMKYYLKRNFYIWMKIDF